MRQFRYIGADVKVQCSRWLFESPEMERMPTSVKDELILRIDRVLRTLASSTASERASPAKGVSERALTDEERRHAAGLMRVNHAGEVCAQALYLGHAATAHTSKVRAVMEQAAKEEEDHLAWCRERLEQLDSRPSRLDPLWFAMSFGLGALSGLAGDRVSLGFVAATEDEVCRHLERHEHALPEPDEKSRAIVKQMREEERRHGTRALEAGGWDFPRPVKGVMGLVAKVMTSTSYRV